MDVTRILDNLDTLTADELRQVADRAAELLCLYDSWQQPNIVATEAAPGGHYQLEMTRCGKDSCKQCADDGQGHGPYWYKYSYVDGKVRKTYIGKRRPG